MAFLDCRYACFEALHRAYMLVCAVNMLFEQFMQVKCNVDVLTQKIKPAVHLDEYMLALFFVAETQSIVDESVQEP
jgi:hypothetical protein